MGAGRFNFFFNFLVDSPAAGASRFGKAALIILDKSKENNQNRVNEWYDFPGKSVDSDTSEL